MCYCLIYILKAIFRNFFQNLHLFWWHILTTSQSKNFSYLVTGWNLLTTKFGNVSSILVLRLIVLRGGSWELSTKRSIIDFKVILLKVLEQQFVFFFRIFLSHSIMRSLQICYFAGPKMCEGLNCFGNAILRSK